MSKQEEERPYVNTTNTRVQVFAEYNEQFILAAHNLGGRYKRRTRMWSFKRGLYPEVAKICNEILGTRLPIRRGKVAID